MKIVADFTINEKYSPSLSAYMEEVWLSVANLDPAQQFIFISTRQKSEGAQVPPNVSVRPTRTTGFRWWDRHRLLRMLNEWQAEKYVAITQHSLHIKRLHAKRGGNSLSQPGTNLFFSDVHRLHSGKQKIPGADIHVIQPAVRFPVMDLSWTESESIKTQYTGGKDFFLFTGDIDEHHKLIELLKAFSGFKKWQQSNMLLVIAGNSTAWTDWFEERLATYKYREDVMLLRDLPEEETARLIAASYALVYPSVQDILPLPVIAAATAGIAAIVSDTSINREATAAAAWVDNNNIEDGFSQSMILLFKDETKKQEIARQMKAGATRPSWQEMIEGIAEKIFSQEIKEKRG
jgi:glycosyltransferase involved in cell wall biosynthesis